MQLQLSQKITIGLYTLTNMSEEGYRTYDRVMDPTLKAILANPSILGEISSGVNQDAINTVTTRIDGLENQIVNTNTNVSWCVGSIGNHHTTLDTHTTSISNLQTAMSQRSADAELWIAVRNYILGAGLFRTIKRYSGTSDLWMDDTHWWNDVLITTNVSIRVNVRPPSLAGTGNLRNLWTNPGVDSLSGCQTTIYNIGSAAVQLYVSDTQIQTSNGTKWVFFYGRDQNGNTIKLHYGGKDGSLVNHSDFTGTIVDPWNMSNDSLLEVVEYNNETFVPVIPIRRHAVIRYMGEGIMSIVIE